MSEWVPLLSSSTDDFELALLRSTEGDELSAEGLLKTAAVLGLGASMMLPAASASPLVASALRLPIWHVVVKWLGLGIFGGLALTSAGMMFGSSSPRLPVVAPMNVTPAALPPRTVVALAPSALPLESEPRAPAAAHSTNAGIRSMPAESASAPPPPLTAASSVAAFALLVEPGPTDNASSIAAQIQTIESARQALAASHPGQALRAIEDYHTRWPSGTLTPEAAVLGVRAKKMLGDTAGAERDGRAFIALYPKSRYAAQLRALLDVARAP